jgi:hypothetical protein
LFRVDSNEVAFSELYPKHDWPIENVLRFLAAARQHSPILDRVTIANISSRRASSVRISYTDLLLALELEAGSTVHFTAPRGSTAFISVDAQLDGTTKSIRAMKDLYLDKPGPSIPVDVTVEIGESDVRLGVRSPISGREQPRTPAWSIAAR